MPFKDVREFIAKLEKEGELQRIEEEVDWNLEAGAILRRSHEERLPAPFFEKIKGYPNDFKLCGGLMAKHRRVAIAMNMAPDTPFNQLMEEYLIRRRQPIKPILVKDGPCKENIQVGDEVDLLKFPVPLIHGGDGGRYVATFHLNISKDPDSDWVNWGMYRGMIHNKNTMGVCADPHTHHGMHLEKYEAANKPMQVAIAIGLDPILYFSATSSVPHMESEVDVAGGIRGAPVELVKCETVDIAVPATAEIIIEGELIPHERWLEGSFGEFTGYQTRGQIARPVIHVKAITHRNNPLFTFSNEGLPLADSHSMISVTCSAEYLEALRAKGLPVTGVYVTPEDALMLTVVAVKTPYANVASDIAHVIWAASPSRVTSYIIVVNDDVDPTNKDQVIHALVSKCHPYKGIHKMDQATIISYVPWADRHERDYRMGGKAYFDCTWPLDWDPSEVPVRVSFTDIYPPEIQQKALAKWQKYGY